MIKVLTCGVSSKMDQPAPAASYFQPQEEQIGRSMADRFLDLCGVFRDAIKDFHFQVLLDPSENSLDLSALPIEVPRRQGGQVRHGHKNIFLGILRTWPQQVVPSFKLGADSSQARDPGGA
jgi:hypothetical protein